MEYLLFFDKVFEVLKTITTKLDIISANLPRQKVIIENSPEDLLNTEEIGKILKTPTSTVLKYIHDEEKKLPAVKYGKEYKIKRADLQEWVTNVYLKKR